MMSELPSKRRSPASNKGTVPPRVFPDTPRENPENGSKSDIAGLDELFAKAGLVRSRREKPAGMARRARIQPATPEELSPPLPVPRVAPNGVEWLPVPEWERISWLWHGFSTRRGGVSRAYCTEDAPGELNLGFTPDDDRENVLRNRTLLA